MIEGSCHCGAVRFTAPAPSEVTDCACSICRRLGVLWAYYEPGEVTITAAPWATRAYVCHSRSQEFHSCNTCGCTTHWRLFDPNPDIMGVNARLMAPEVLAAASVVRTAGPP